MFILGYRVLDVSIRRFITGNLRFVPDDGLDYICQNLMSFDSLNTACQDIGINPYIKVLSEGNYYKYNIDLYHRYP